MSYRCGFAMHYSYGTHTEARRFPIDDAQYAAEELQKRPGWGHSNFDQAMQLAETACVKRLALTHHDPKHDDEFL